MVLKNRWGASPRAFAPVLGVDNRRDPQLITICRQLKLSARRGGSSQVYSPRLLRLVQQTLGVARRAENYVSNIGCARQLAYRICLCL